MAWLLMLATLRYSAIAKGCMHRLVIKSALVLLAIQLLIFIQIAGPRTLLSGATGLVTRHVLLQQFAFQGGWKWPP